MRGAMLFAAGLFVGMAVHQAAAQNGSGVVMMNHVAINVPVALADLVFKALPDEAIADLRKEGYDARSFWEAVKKTGPAEILTVEGKDGERIQVWLE